MMNTAVQLLAAGILCLPVSYLAGEWKNFSFSQVHFNSWFAVFYLVTMGSIVAYTSYLYLIKTKPPAQVSTYVYVNPVVALILGAIIANESVNAVKVIGLGIILGGVLLVNIVKYGSR
jgi:drug/metabolite transporter (DMT)-like permease